MRDWMETLGLSDNGIITAATAARAGVPAREVQRAAASGELVRVRPGAYVSRDVWRASSLADRHRLLVLATARQLDRPIVVSHLSALALHGIPIVGRWPQAVQVLEADAVRGSSTRFLTSHTGHASSTVVIEGVEVVRLERALIDVARTCPLEASVIAIDAALRRTLLGRASSAMSGGITVERLSEELEQLAPRYGGRCAESAIRLGDGRSENPGESLSRVRLHQLGFEAPELQVRFPRANRGRDAVVDFWWRGRRKAGEFDGKHKYTRGRYVADDRELGDVVFEEKRREDALRRSAIDSMARWVWDEVFDARTFYGLMMECDVPRAARAARASSMRAEALDARGIRAASSASVRIEERFGPRPSHGTRDTRARAHGRCRRVVAECVPQHKILGSNGSRSGCRDTPGPHSTSRGFPEMGGVDNSGESGGFMRNGIVIHCWQHVNNTGITTEM